jgi:mycoredoxin
MTVTVFGADWCADCIRSKRLLDRLDVPYAWIDLVTSPDRIDEVMRVNDGMPAIPVLLFPDGSHLTEPSDRELSDHLTELGLLTPA